MEPIAPDMHRLFAQLGESTDDAAIDRFIGLHIMQGGAIALHEASCWSKSQSDFLRQAIDEDAEWAPIVDQLNARFHRSPFGLPSRPLALITL